MTTQKVVVLGSVHKEVATSTADKVAGLVGRLLGKWTKLRMRLKCRWEPGFAGIRAPDGLRGRQILH